MTAGLFCWQIDQMQERLNTLRTSFEQQHLNDPQQVASLITGLEELLDQLEGLSSEISELPNQQNAPGIHAGSLIGGDLITDERGVIIEASDGMAALVNVPIPVLEGRPWGIYLDPKSTRGLVYEHEIATDRVRWFGEAEDLHLYPVTGNGWLEAVHPDDREPVRRATIRHLKTGAPFAEEYRLRLRDGRVIMITVRATVIRGPGGVPLRWVGAVIDITAQRAVGRALQKSEERFRTLAESIRDGLTIVEEGRIVYLNDQAVTIFGYPREELLEMDPTDLAEAEEVPLLISLMEECERTRTTPEVLEFWIHQKDGTRRCIRNRFTAFKNGSYSVFTTDITQRRSAEEQGARYAKDLERQNGELGVAAAHLHMLTADLDHQKQWLHGILAAIPEELVIIGRDLRFSYVNPSAATALGMEVKEIVGRTWQELRASAGVELSFSDQVARVFGEGVVVRGQIRRDVNGTVRYLAYLLSPVYGQTGGVEGIIAASRDVTDRVVAVEALEDSERRYRSLVDLAPDGIVIHQQGRVVYMNPAGARLFGAEAADPFIGVEMVALIHPEEREMVNRRIREMEDGAVMTAPLTEVRVIRPDNVLVTIEITSAVIPYNAGQAIHSVLRDITARKKTENCLKIANHHLMQSNRDLEQFAYVASHDLNEPLRTMLSYIQLLEKRYKPVLGPDAGEMIGFIVDGGERMKEMIADLLNYSRLTRKGPSVGTVDCEDLLNKTLSQLGHLIAEENALVTHDPLPCVSGDAGLLQQVFMNLTANAIKFHGPLQPEVHISAAQGGDAWTFAFRDNGIGVPADAQERIFLMFQRLHTQADFPGTGIGLTICRKVIERHGGRLWVESDEGRGSTFFFTLPTPGLHLDDQVPGFPGQGRGQH